MRICRGECVSRAWRILLGSGKGQTLWPRRQRSLHRPKHSGHKVLQRLGHFQAFDVEVSRVKKVFHPLMVPEMRLGLRELVVVVRKLEVHAAGVNVDVRPEDVAGDHGTFYVPSGSPFPPRRTPERLAWLRRLP